MDDHKKKLAMIEAEKEKEGQHPRSISQIRRANEVKPFVKGFNEEDGDIKSSSTSTKSVHPTSLENLCSSNEISSEISVICSWTTNCIEEGSAVGQHHLRKLAVLPEHSCQGCPVLISSKHNTAFSHDFTSGPLVSFF